MRKWFGTCKKTKPILDLCKVKVQSVPYKVSLRWLYYQCVQEGLVRKSYNGLKSFEQLITEARKRFYDIWSPDTLSDSLRKPYFIGHANHNFDINLDTIKDRDFYVQCWYEAEAMTEQFLHFTTPYRVSLVAFRGDPSLSIKWKLAKYLEQIHKEYPDKPIKILYFGDCDDKGEQIPQSALTDIRAWCNAPFDFIPCGLTLPQAQDFNLPKNPEKIDQYQWESLSNSQAEDLIIHTMAKFLKPIPQSVLDEENDLEEQLNDYYDTL